MKIDAFRKTWQFFLITTIISVLLCVTTQLGATGQGETSDEEKLEYPNQPVKIVVPYGAGGATDVIYRVISSVVDDYWDEPIVIVNKPGGGGTIGANYVAKSKPNGYTILAALQGPLILNPLQIKVDYTYDDFEPVCQLVNSPMVIVTNPNTEWDSVDDMIQYGKKNPGKLTFGSTGAGNMPHLMTLRLKEVTGIDFEVIPFKGNAPAKKELLAGNIDGYISPVDSAILKGEIQPIAILQEERLPQLKDVPTMEEMGYPEMIADVWWGIVVPKGTPQAIKVKLNETMKAVSEDQEFISMMEKSGNFIAYLSTDEFAEKMDKLHEFLPAFLEKNNLLQN